MNDKIVVLTEDDVYISLEQWQGVYDLKLGSTEIGKYFDAKEARFQKDLVEFGKLVVCAPLMVILDKYRELIKEPVTINSFNRTEEYQVALKAKGLRAAKTSPHVEKMAADVDTFDVKDTESKVPMMRQASVLTGIPIRIGWKTYTEIKQSFIHVDVCPLYYAKGKPRNSEAHPAVWELQNEW